MEIVLQKRATITTSSAAINTTSAAATTAIATTTTATYIGTNKRVQTRVPILSLGRMVNNHIYKADTCITGGGGANNKESGVLVASALKNPDLNPSPTTTYPSWAAKRSNKCQECNVVPISTSKHGGYALMSVKDLNDENTTAVNADECGETPYFHGHAHDTHDTMTAYCDLRMAISSHPRLKLDYTTYYAENCKGLA